MANPGARPIPGIAFWIRIPDEDEIVLVDPLPMSSEELDQVERTDTPTHILLTLENLMGQVEKPPNNAI